MVSRRRATGQHFLHDPRVVERIVAAADVGSDDRILEIGPGHGALTGPLLETGADVVAVESDGRLVDELARRFATIQRFKLHHADATDADLASWGPYTKVVANLPYVVSTPLTFRLLDLDWSQAVLMYQQEFAERMAAGPGSKTYGRLTAAVAYHANVERLFRVPRGAFSPPPKVGSAVVRLVPHEVPPFPVPDVGYYRDTLRVVFGHRRKTLRATLRNRAAELGVDPSDAMATVERLGWAGERPETLAPADLGRLADALWEVRSHG